MDRHYYLEILVGLASHALFTMTGTMHILSGWWFGTFFIFPYIGNNHPNWLIFFRGAETTNQLSYMGYAWICFKWRLAWTCCIRIGKMVNIPSWGSPFLPGRYSKSNTQPFFAGTRWIPQDLYRSTPTGSEKVTRRCPPYTGASRGESPGQVWSVSWDDFSGGFCFWPGKNPQTW